MKKIKATKEEEAAELNRLEQEHREEEQRLEVGMLAFHMWLI